MKIYLPPGRSSFINYLSCFSGTLAWQKVCFSIFWAFYKIVKDCISGKASKMSSKALIFLVVHAAKSWHTRNGIGRQKNYGGVGTASDGKYYLKFISPKNKNKNSERRQLNASSEWCLLFVGFIFRVSNNWNPLFQFSKWIGSRGISYLCYLTRMQCRCFSWENC